MGPLGGPLHTVNIKTDDDGRPVRIFIDEHLTTMRANLCKFFRVSKVSHYTRDGKVFYNSGSQESENWKVLDTPTDWENFNMPVGQKEELGIYPKL